MQGPVTTLNAVRQCWECRACILLQLCFSEAVKTRRKTDCWLFYECPVHLKFKTNELCKCLVHNLMLYSSFSPPFIFRSLWKTDQIKHRSQPRSHSDPINILQFIRIQVCCCMSKNTIIDKYIIAMQHYLTNSVAFVSEMFDVVFHSKIIQADGLLTKTIVLYGFVTNLVEFGSDLSSVLYLVSLNWKHECREQRHEGCFSTTHRTGQ